MKSLLMISSAFLIAFPCFAQRSVSRTTTTRNYLPGSTPVGLGGFGNVLYPGTGSPATVPGGRSARRSSGVVTGYGFAGYPLYVGGAYVPSYAPDYSSLSQFNPQQQYSSSPVIINQYFPQPLPPEPATTFYQPSSDRPLYDDSSSAPAQPKYYLIAFKDHSVYSALAYWVEDKTLHYVTTQNTHNQASLDLVDLDFTKQLNQDREVPFSIETPSK